MANETKPGAMVSEEFSRLITIGVVPLSIEQITPEIRLLASRCILADADSAQFSRDAHKYAAYTIIRERQLVDALTALAATKRDGIREGLEMAAMLAMQQYSLDDNRWNRVIRHYRDAIRAKANEVGQ